MIQVKKIYMLACTMYCHVTFVRSETLEEWNKMHGNQGQEKHFEI
jgi:hypothetical protein